jgi:hypothetical protein
MAVGVVIFLLGLWVLLRTVRGQRKLPDVILGS